MTRERIGRERPGPPHSQGGLYGGARTRNGGPRAVFLFRQGGHLHPPKVCSIDSARREDHHGAFYFLKKIDFVRFFYFFVKKTLFVDEKSTFIIIITFHQITHQLVLSIFTWDFIFSSKFSL